MNKYGITRTIEINDSEKLLQMINITMDELDNISLSNAVPEEYIQYNGCFNALNIIEKTSFKN